MSTMYSKSTIMEKLKELQNSNELKGYKFGLAGSYVRGEETEDSDIDVITDTDELTMEQIFFIKDTFKCEVDVVQLPLLKEEEDRLQRLTEQLGISPNDDNAYDNIIKEVQWVE